MLTLSPADRAAAATMARLLELDFVFRLPVGNPISENATERDFRLRFNACN